MILVVGASGALGSEICRRLRSRNLPVRGLVRPGSAREADLRALGVEISSGDLRSSAAIDAACNGVSVVISTATAMGAKDKSLTLRAIDHDAQLEVVNAAKRHGVKTFVYISLSPQLQGAPLVRYKREVETAVRASGMQWTILQPSAFMEIWLSPLLGWDFVKGAVTMCGAGTAPMGWISLEDVAEYAVRSLDDARLANRDIPLTGPALLSTMDVVKIFEGLRGKRFKAKHIPPALLALMSPVVGLFNEMAASGMQLMVQTSHGDNFDTSFQRELHFPMKTVQQYAAGVIAKL